MHYLIISTPPLFLFAVRNARLNDHTSFYCRRTANILGQPIRNIILSIKEKPRFDWLSPFRNKEELFLIGPSMQPGPRSDNNNIARLLIANIASTCAKQGWGLVNRDETRASAMNDTKLIGSSTGSRGSLRSLDLPPNSESAFLPDRNGAHPPSLGENYLTVTTNIVIQNEHLAPHTHNLHAQITITTKVDNRRLSLQIKVTIQKTKKGLKSAWQHWDQSRMLSRCPERSPYATPEWHSSFPSMRRYKTKGCLPLSIYWLYRLTINIRLKFCDFANKTYEGENTPNQILLRIRICGKMWLNLKMVT